MSYQSRFDFVGTPLIPKPDSKRPFCNELTKKDKGTGRDMKMLSLNFGVKESEHNLGFVEAFDSVKDVVKTLNTDNEPMEVNWENRLDKDVLLQVANYRKYVVDLGDNYGGRNEFITAYDMIQYLQKLLPTYEGRIVVTGQFTREWYKQKYMNKFKIQGVYAAAEERKSRLRIVADLYYNKDSFDDSDFNDNKKILLDCYIEQYINKDEGRKYVPIQAVFSAAKYNMENEEHSRLFNYKMKYLKSKKKNMVHIPWEMVMLSGAEEVDFDESKLTDAQREQVELGIRTVDDFRPRNNIYGERVEEFRLFDPKLEGDYADGLVDAADNNDEFEEKIYQPPRDETLDEAKANSKKNTKAKGETPDASPEDLF